MDELCDLPKPCKDIHMSVCKVFDMFFNKKNRYDSDTEMLQDIKKALYDPVNIRRLSQLDPAIQRILHYKFMYALFDQKKKKIMYALLNNHPHVAFKIFLLDTMKLF